MMDEPRFEVVILAGGDCKRLYPLTAGGAPKALLPVGNRPLISYALRHLAEAGVKAATVVATGEGVAAALRAYLSSQQQAGVACRVVAVGEGAGTADALRAVLPQLDPDAAGVVVYAADLVCDAPLRAVLVSHQLSGALATVLVGARRVSPAAETKPGRAPRCVDYLGLDAARRLLLFSASSPEALRDLKVPLAAVRRHGAVEVRSDLVDHHLYVLSPAALRLLESKKSLSSVKLDLIPALCRLQLQQQQQQAAGDIGGLLGGVGGVGGGSSGAAGGGGGAAEGAAGGSAAASPVRGGGGSGADGSAAVSGASAAASAASGGAGGAGGAAAAEGASGGAAAAAAAELAALPGADYMRLTHFAATRGSGLAGRVAVYFAPQGKFVGRVNTLQAFGDVNREVAAPDVALHLTGLQASRYDNVVAPTAVLGAKATVGPACIVGDGSALGDKCSVKRSVIGGGCK